MILWYAHLLGMGAGDAGEEPAVTRIVLAFG